MVQAIRQRDNLTPKQRSLLQFLVEAIEKRGVPPTLREIGARFDIRSTQGVRDHLKALERKGYLRRRPRAARSIELVAHKVRTLFPNPWEVPVVGRIPAGPPTLAVEHIEDTISLDKLFPIDEGVFALRVRGDSMVGAGILTDDLVIVKPQPDADHGDIVVARLGDETTVKRLWRQGKKVVLEPANSAYEPIVVEEGTLVGKVVGVIRLI